MPSANEIALQHYQRYGANILRHVLHRSDEEIAKWERKVFWGGPTQPFLRHRSAQSYVLHELIPLRLRRKLDHLNRTTLRNRIGFALANEDFSKDSADFALARERIRKILAEYGEDLPP